MEARLQREARQDSDSKLTPFRYEDIRRTQAEFFQRSQVNVQARSQFRTIDFSVDFLKEFQ